MGTTRKENWFDYFCYSYAKFYIQFDFELVINLENVIIGIFTATIRIMQVLMFSWIIKIIALRTSELFENRS